MMRTALLISGHFRDAHSCFPSIKEQILDRYNADVFISTWNPEGDFHNYVPVPTRVIQDSFTFDQVIKAYKPKSIKSEDFDSEKIKQLITKAWELDAYGPMNGETNSASILCMWYKISSALSLMQEYELSCDFKYDYVIKGRFDIQIHDDLEIGKNSSYANIPPGFDWRGGYNDILAWGSRDAMVHYCSLFHRIEDYVRNHGIFFHPETMLKHHLNNSTFGVERPGVRVTLRDKNVWEFESNPYNGKKI